jgi:hypothetical protein
MDEELSINEINTGFSDFDSLVSSKIPNNNTPKRMSAKDLNPIKVLFLSNEAPLNLLLFSIIPN